MISLIPDSHLLPLAAAAMVLAVATVLAGAVVIYLLTSPYREHFGVRQRLPGYVALYFGLVALQVLTFLITV